MQRQIFHYNLPFPSDLISTNSADDSFLIISSEKLSIVTEKNINWKSYNFLVKNSDIHIKNVFFSGDKKFILTKKLNQEEYTFQTIKISNIPSELTTDFSPEIRKDKMIIPINIQNEIKLFHNLPVNQIEFHYLYSKWGTKNTSIFELNPTDVYSLTPEITNFLFNRFHIKLKLNKEVKIFEIDFYDRYIRSGLTSISPIFKNINLEPENYLIHNFNNLYNTLHGHIMDNNSPKGLILGLKNLLILNLAYTSIRNFGSLKNDFTIKNLFNNIDVLAYIPTKFYEKILFFHFLDHIKYGLNFKVWNFILENKLPVGPFGIPVIIRL